MSGSDQTNSPSPNPRTVTEHAANAALDTIRYELAKHGVEAEQAFILINAKNPPAGEPPCCTAGRGYATPGDLLADLLGYASAAGKQMGIDVDLLFPTVRGEG
jgi:hypothetical protein